jgi:hypothetical protein
VLLPSRPLTHPWAERHTGRRRKPSLWHSSMAFRCSPPGHPPSTHPWAEPRTGCCCKPSLRHSSMVFPCTRQDPRSLYLRHSSCGPRRRGPVSGTPVPRWLPQLDGARYPHARGRLGGRLWRHQPYHTHPGHIFSPRLSSLAHPSSLLVMVLSYPSPQ